MSPSSPQSAAHQTFLPVRVLLFAVLRDTLKRDEIEVMVSTRAGSPPTVADLVTACTDQFPSISAWLPYIRVAVNCEYSSSQTLLSPGAEVAFIPPVAGG